MAIINDFVTCTHVLPFSSRGFFVVVTLIYNFYDWTKIVFFMIINIKLSKKFYLSFCETLFIFYVQLNKKCSVSPGGFTLKHAQKMEKKLKNQRLRQSLFSSKRRRLELKSQRAMKNCTQSVLEGTVYTIISTCIN